MKQLATVVIENGKPMAEVMRPEACEACRACKFGRQQRMLMELPKGDYKQGDCVELSLPDGNVRKASMLAYGIPLALMLIGLWLGSVICKAELWQAGGALLGVALGVLIIRCIEPRLRKSGVYHPTACPIDAQQARDLLKREGNDTAGEV